MRRPQHPAVLDEAALPPHTLPAGKPQGIGIRLKETVNVDGARIDRGTVLSVERDPLAARLCGRYPQVCELVNLDNLE
jgi:hypothetical protein